jgi:hypothetical protein
MPIGRQAWTAWNSIRAAIGNLTPGATETGNLTSQIEKPGQRLEMTKKIKIWGRNRAEMRIQERRKESEPFFKHGGAESVAFEVQPRGELHDLSVRGAARSGDEDPCDLELDRGIPHLCQDLGRVGLESREHQAHFAVFVSCDWSCLREEFPKPIEGASGRRQLNYLPEMGDDGSDRGKRSG